MRALLQIVLVSAAWLGMGCTVEQWLFQPGSPAKAPQTRSGCFDALDRMRRAWLDEGQLPDDEHTQKWVTQEWVYFIEGMPQALSHAQLQALDAAYAFTGTANGEIA